MEVAYTEISELARVAEKIELTTRKRLIAYIEDMMTRITSNQNSRNLPFLALYNDIDEFCQKHQIQSTELSAELRAFSKQDRDNVLMYQAFSNLLLCIRGETDTLGPIYLQNLSLTVPWLAALKRVAEELHERSNGSKEDTPDTSEMDNEFVKCYADLLFAACPLIQSAAFFNDRMQGQNKIRKDIFRNDLAVLQSNIPQPVIERYMEARRIFNEKRDALFKAETESGFIFNRELAGASDCAEVILKTLDEAAKRLNELLYA